MFKTMHHYFFLQELSLMNNAQYILKIQYDEDWLFTSLISRRQANKPDNQSHYKIH